MTDPTMQLHIVPTPARVERATELPTDLIDEVTLAARLGVARSTLQSWRYNRCGPRFIKVGRLVRYRNADVEAYLRANVHEARSE